mmetsp:Transcript_11583/g.17520  ORF Transcript_11583/g.17520 Transcript_11583/m.17520 type:complete len:82 (-) Transcript_11583:538-783(-)
MQHSVSYEFQSRSKQSSDSNNNTSNYDCNNQNAQHIMPHNASSSQPMLLHPRSDRRKRLGKSSIAFKLPHLRQPNQVQPSV